MNVTTKPKDRIPRIRFTLADYSLGSASPRPFDRLLLAGTERGICAIYLGESDAWLEAELRRAFPAALVQRDDPGLECWVRAIVNHLSGQKSRLDLPLHVRATVFQCRVWQELCTIPYGSTRSYRDIAAALGRPNAVRAVARACAANPLSLVIPCHRVVRANGGLGGYRWGLERKQALLDREAAIVSGAPAVRGGHVRESRSAPGPNSQ